MAVTDNEVFCALSILDLIANAVSLSILHFMWVSKVLNLILPLLLFLFIYYYFVSKMFHKIYLKFWVVKFDWMNFSPPISIKSILYWKLMLLVNWTSFQSILISLLCSYKYLWRICSGCLLMYATYYYCCSFLNSFLQFLFLFFLSLPYLCFVLIIYTTYTNLAMKSELPSNRSSSLSSNQR